MAVQIPDPGTGNGQTGDNEYVFRKKVKDNFSDQTNAASRLVGPAAGNVMEVGAFGLGSMTAPVASKSHEKPPIGFSTILALSAEDTSETPSFQHVITTAWSDTSGGAQLLLGLIGDKRFGYRNWDSSTGQWGTYVTVRSSVNTSVDGNGFLKSASPVVDMYDNKIDLNHDATEQGGITFEKLGVGDYLVKGSLGFAQEGWYIETPKDANGNVLVAVVYEQLENNDISIKTYAKKFDDETGDIVANLLKPRDIPTGRFISLRLHELPKEPPVMPTETQPEV